MAKINSKDKGKRGEYKVRNALEEWLGVTFRRTPGSGSFASTTGYTDLCGDLSCDDPKFKFSIEIKNQEKWSLEQLLTSDKCSIKKWWLQTKTQCPVDKLPILFFTKNHSPIFCITREDDLILDIPKLVFKVDADETLNIYLFTELKNINKSEMFYK